VKHTLLVKEDKLTWAETLIDCTIGPLGTGEQSNCGTIRRNYTQNYKPIDQIDQTWYSVCYDKRDNSWFSCYIWGIILDGVLNARAAYCETNVNTEPVKDFIEKLIDDIRSEYN
jgi:hypothetical protein